MLSTAPRAPHPPPSRRPHGQVGVSTRKQRLREVLSNISPRRSGTFLPFLFFQDCSNSQVGRFDHLPAPEVPSSSEKIKFKKKISMEANEVPNSTPAFRPAWEVVGQTHPAPFCPRAETLRRPLVVLHTPSGMAWRDRGAHTPGSQPLPSHLFLSRPGRHSESLTQARFAQL